MLIFSFNPFIALNLCFMFGISSLLLSWIALFIVCRAITIHIIWSVKYKRRLERMYRFSLRLYVGVNASLLTTDLYLYHLEGLGIRLVIFNHFPGKAKISVLTKQLLGCLTGLFFNLQEPLILFYDRRIVVLQN